mgnify:CR=1 FL=1
MGLPADRLPMILGCDGAGVDPDGNEVIVHAVVASPGWGGDETLDPKRSLLSEVHDGTLAERWAVPRSNPVPKRSDLSWGAAACPPTRWRRPWLGESLTELEPTYGDKALLIE